MKRRGFTLLEVLITVGIISILSGITIVAINPSKQFGQANNAVRFSDVNNILSAVGQYAVKHRGALPTGDGTVTQMDDNFRFIESSSTSTGLDLCSDLVGEDFLPEMPTDPSLTADFTVCGEDYHTGYQIKYDNGHVSVHAPYAEQEEEITVTY